MKLKITDDFKRAFKGVLIYLIAAIIVFPVYHLIKGDFLWEDTFINVAIQVGIALVIGVFFFFGFQIPEKK